MGSLHTTANKKWLYRSCLLLISPVLLTPDSSRVLKACQQLHQTPHHFVQQRVRNNDCTLRLLLHRAQT
jgi:hypothetical protein